MLQSASILVDRPSISGAPVALLNPQAAGGRAAKRSAPWRKRLPRDCQIIECRSREQVEAEAFQASSAGASIVIAVGGDGTVHHAANGLLRAGNPAVQFAVIPAGTANDYWATLEEYAPRDSNTLVFVDVGEIRQGSFHKFFLNAAGLGFAAETAVAAQSYRRWPARFRYLLGLLHALVRNWKLSPLRVQTLDCEPVESKILLLSIAKGKREGSFCLAPQAQLNDGQFHLLRAEDLRRRDVLRYLPGVCIGKLPKSDSRIQFQTCQKLTLRPQMQLRFHLDGELYGESFLGPAEDVEILLHPRRLPIHFLS